MPVVFNPDQVITDLCRHTGSEALFKHDKVETVYSLHESVELIFRHYLAPSAKAIRPNQRIFMPWTGNLCKLVWGDVSDVCLVRRIGFALAIGTQVSGKLFQVVRIRVGLPLNSLGSSHVDKHVWRMDKNVAHTS